MEMLSIQATALGRSSLSSRSSTKSSTSHTHFKMDDDDLSSNNNNPIKPQLQSSKLKQATRCYRPKEWNSKAEEAFRVQQAGWRDIQEYRETYGEPERWENGFVRCTRVKANGYYTYWRSDRECADKYLNTVKLYEYA